MSNYLHITNGDDAANIIKACGVEGDVLPWRDTMHYGPFPARLDLDEVSLIRADYFSHGLALDHAEVTRDFLLRNKHLAAAGRYQEVVLWFEHDLLDQLQILQLLDWFAQHPIACLSFICIDHFDGIEPFRGIGQLSAWQMASLFDSRLAITQQQLDVAQKGWAAFRASTPKQLSRFIESCPTEPLPFLQPALLRHLAEYPHVCDGLSLTERQILNIVANGTENPSQLFIDNMLLERVLFIGDWATYTIVEFLCGGEHPLLYCASGNKFFHPAATHVSQEMFMQQRLKLTAIGEKVLAGELNAVDVMQRDQWLGGVHLNSEKSMWMWDECANNWRLKVVD